MGTFYVCFAAHLGSTGGFLLLHYSSSVVDNPGTSKCLNTMFLSSPYLYFIIGFNCDLFVARNDSWISQKTSTRIKQIYAFITMEAEGKGKDPKLACPLLPPYRPYPPPHTHSLSPPSPLPPTVIHYWPFQSSTFIVALFVYCYVVFHFLMFFFSVSLGHRVATFLGKSC